MHYKLSGSDGALSQSQDSRVAWTNDTGLQLVVRLTVASLKGVDVEEIEAANYETIAEWSLD